MNNFLSESLQSTEELATSRCRHGQSGSLPTQHRAVHHESRFPQLLLHFPSQQKAKHGNTVLAFSLDLHSLRWQTFRLIADLDKAGNGGTRHGHQTPGPLISGLQIYEKHRISRKVQLDVPKIKNGGRGWISMHGLTIQFQR